MVESGEKKLYYTIKKRENKVQYDKIMRHLCSILKKILGGVSVYKKLLNIIALVERVKYYEKSK